MKNGCPDEMTLAALFDGALEPAERDALYGHTLGCDTCQTELAAIGLAGEEFAALAELPPAPAHLLDDALARFVPADETPSPIAIAVRLVKGALESLPDALAPMPTPALAVRGAAAAVEPQDPGLRYQLDVQGTPVELHLVPQRDGRIDLTARPLRRLPPRTRLELEHGGRVEASLSVESAPVDVSDLGAGRYLLRFVAPSTPPTVVPLRLEA